jgi:hypothetical protein
VLTCPARCQSRGRPTSRIDREDNQSTFSLPHARSYPRDRTSAAEGRGGGGGRRVPASTPMVCPGAKFYAYGQLRANVMEDRSQGIPTYISA